ncbi:YfiR family protein [Azonexus sp.]|uniref:YfiR family protein n=1 Tax=Azonexus sp. TaxID=1872668 RepID=UPI0027BB1357|nr:YfiR family protein [Azonexus sp.]
MPRSAFLALLLCCTLQPGRLQAQDVSEYGMKAVLFYRLAQFIYWPGEAPAPKPTVLCVGGKNPFGSALTQADRNSGTVEIRVAPNELSGCHLLFIPRSESSHLTQWLERAAARNLVTVSDINGFARAGGMLELPLEGERIGIVLNRRVANRQGFEFSAQLLRLARVIEP